jgi:hypothetical protein
MKMKNFIKNYKVLFTIRIGYKFASYVWRKQEIAFINLKINRHLKLKRYAIWKKVESI